MSRISIQPSAKSFRSIIRHSPLPAIFLERATLKMRHVSGKPAFLVTGRHWLVIMMAIPIVATAQVPTMRETVTPIRIEASPARTWDTVLEFLTVNHISLRFTDGSSRFAYSERYQLLLPDSLPGADCGRDVVSVVPRMWLADAHLAIHVLPLSDSTASLRVTATYSSRNRFCQPSNGSYERLIQQLIRQRATNR